jgi:hypothetical protein
MKRSFHILVQPQPFLQQNCMHGHCQSGRSETELEHCHLRTAPLLGKAALQRAFEVSIVFIGLALAYDPLRTDDATI